MKTLFFKDWTEDWHRAIWSAVMFLILFCFIRLTGKRTLASLTAFDFVVIIAIGTILSSTMLAMVSIASGATALIVVIALQFALAYAAKQSPRLEYLVNDTPTLLFYRGQFLAKNLSREVITEREVYAEISRSGIHDIAEVEAVVMELNGMVTVIRRLPGDSPAAVIAVRYRRHAMSKPNVGSVLILKISQLFRIKPYLCLN